MAPAPETGKEAWERGMKGPGLYTGAGIFSVFAYVRLSIKKTWKCMQ